MSKSIDSKALFKIPYGLFVLTAKEDKKDNGCIVNTVLQLTAAPITLAVALNKENYTHGMIKRTKLFNVSVLNQNTPFSVFKQFGFCSGRDTEKFGSNINRSENGLAVINDYSNAIYSVKVTTELDCGTHTLFIGEVTQAQLLNEIPSITYSYYQENVKPKPQKVTSEKRVYVCEICGYVYDEAKEKVAFKDLPDDWVCPLCKHPKSDFKLQE